MFLKIKQKFEQPLFWLRFVSVAICLIGLVRIFAIIGPAIVIAPIFRVEGSNIFIALASALNTYLDGVRETFGIESKVEVLYLFSLSFFVSLSFIVSGIFLFLRKLWARNTLLSLVVLEILGNFIIMLLRGRFIINFMAIDLLIIYISLLIFFTRRQVIQLFTKNA